MATRVFIRNVFKGNQLSQTLTKYSTWIGEQVFDTSRNEWMQEDYQYDARGRNVRETYRVVNATTNPSIYVSKIQQYAYERYGRLRWSADLYQPQDTIPRDTLAMIPNNFDRIYMRGMREWRDSFLALEYGKQRDDQVPSKIIEAREEGDEALLEPYTRRILYLDGYFYSPDATGRLVKRIHLGGRPQITVDSFCYDKRGRLVRWSINDLVSNKKQWTFAYDQNSRVTACDLVVYTGNGFFSKLTVNNENTQHFLLSYNANGTVRQIKLQAMRYGKLVDEYYFVPYQCY